MSFLETQVANEKARVRRAERAAEDALRRAGRPFTRWGLLTDEALRESKVHVLTREALVSRLNRNAALPTTKPSASETLRDIVKRIHKHPRDIPHLIVFREGGAQLHFITPLDP